MTPHQKRTLSPITQRMAGDMLVRNLAQRTIDTYTYHVERFSKHFGRPLDQLGPEEIRGYQLHPRWNEVLSGLDRPRWYDPFGRARARSSRRGYREPPDG